MIPQEKFDAAIEAVGKAICAAEGLEPDNWRHRTAEARKFINVWNALAALEADLFKTASDAALDGVKNGGKGGKT